MGSSADLTGLAHMATCDWWVSQAWVLLGRVGQLAALDLASVPLSALASYHAVVQPGLLTWGWAGLGSKGVRAEAARPLRPEFQNMYSFFPVTPIGPSKSQGQPGSKGGEIGFTSEWSHILKGCVCPGMQRIGVIQKLPRWPSQKEFRPVTNCSLLSASVSLSVQWRHWVWWVSGPECV